MLILFKMKYVYIVLCGIFFASCQSFKNDKLQKKTYQQQITNGKITKLVDRGRGTFNVIYESKGEVDTIYIAGFNIYYNLIDTLSILNKDSNSYRLEFVNLKNEEGRRYNENILLIYW